VLNAVIKELSVEQRLALFGSSRALQELVLTHCGRVTLRLQLPRQLAAAGGLRPGVAGRHMLLLNKAAASPSIRLLIHHDSLERAAEVPRGADSAVLSVWCAEMYARVEDSVLCRVRSLELRSLALASLVPTEILRVLPELRELVLQNCRVSPDGLTEHMPSSAYPAWHRLSPAVVAPDCLPKTIRLKEVQLESCTWVDTSTQPHATHVLESCVLPYAEHLSQVYAHACSAAHA
jgi:hypothetical protein